jgi:antitoxin component HigA of HigAB toxin-antitoxin module
LSGLLAKDVKMNVKIIKDQAEYEAMLEQLSSLMNKELVPGSEDENHIELLQLVLKDYEEKHLRCCRSRPNRSN